MLKGSWEAAMAVVTVTAVGSAVTLCSVGNCDRGSTFTGSKVAEATATEMVRETAMAAMMAKASRSAVKPTEGMTYR
jgi:hypothetical protein